jgi:parallel beta-helix repeat protein
VSANQIDFTGANGIHAVSTSNSEFVGNMIGLNGTIKGDGILLENTSNNGPAYTRIYSNTITNTLSPKTDFGSGVQVLNSNDVTVSYNKIYNVAWDGVRVEKGNNILVENNDIDDAVRSGVYFEKVTNGAIDTNQIDLVGWYGVDVRGGSNLNITGNTIDDTGKEGINAEQVGSSLDVVGNTVTTTGSHGISVKSSNLVSIMSNTVGSVLGAIKGLGIFVSAPGQLDIGAAGTGNTVTNTDKDGIFVDGFGAGVVSIIDNDVSDSDTNGIGARNVDDLTIADNTVKNVVNAGVRIIGSYYGNAVVSGNEVTDADVGMLFESGLIDLTGASNKLTGGSVGYRFAPVALKGGFSQVDLKDDTIGTTEFTGQSTFYVELLNGALFAPGAPTLEDGLNATYDGFNPSSVGGILTAAQYNALENMFWHYVDDNTVGLFFFGSAPDIQQNRIFRQDINNFIPDGGNAGFTIAGLPNLPGGGPNLPDLDNPTDLNNLAPAASGGETGDEELTEEQLAALAPAAGGQDAACWDDAVNLASNGQVASYDFTTDPLSALQDANNCGTPNN